MSPAQRVPQSSADSNAQWHRARGPMSTRSTCRHGSPVDEVVCFCRPFPVDQAFLVWCYGRFDLYPTVTRREGRVGGRERGKGLGYVIRWNANLEERKKNEAWTSRPRLYFRWSALLMTEMVLITSRLGGEDRQSAFKHLHLLDRMPFNRGTAKKMICLQLVRACFKTLMSSFVWLG